VNYTKSEIDDLAFGRLTPEKLQQAVEAFHGFINLFGKPWLDKVFQGIRSTDIVLKVVSLWEDWCEIRGLSKSEKILKRWKSGIYDGGVISEIQVMAHLVRMKAEVELFPKVGNRCPDLRFRKNSQWVYCEVSHRGISKVRKRVEEILHQVASAAGKAIDGKHGKVAILRDLADGELESLISWLGSLSDYRQTKLNDLAVFRTCDMGGTMDQDDLKLVPTPRLCATSLNATDGHISQKGSACMCISDRSAQGILETEAAQLPRDYPGVVILDLSTVIEGCTEWSPLVQRRFQPNINTRISGVLLFNITLNRNGPKIEGNLLINHHSRNQLPGNVARILEGMVTTKRGESTTQQGDGLPIFQARFKSKKSTA
jgi:hypothetical protein